MAVGVTVGTGVAVAVAAGSGGGVGSAVGSGRAAPAQRFVPVPGWRRSAPAERYPPRRPFPAHPPAALLRQVRRAEDPPRRIQAGPLP